VLHRKQIALAGMATGLAMTSIGIGGLIVGNAGAEEPGHHYATDESGVSLISPVAPLEKSKSSSTPSQAGPPSQMGPGSEVPEVAEPVPASPRSVEESAGGYMPLPARPTQVPSEPRPTGRPTESPSEPSQSPSDSPSDPSESPSDDPTESPSEPTESPSEPSESPSESPTD